MARKTKKQQDAQAQVEARLTSDGPVRLDASAVQSGGSRGSTKTISEIHPSLEGATESLSGAGLHSGTITTPSGLSVTVARQRQQGAGGEYKPQAPEFGQERATTPVQEGVSQRYEQQIGREHGRAKASELTAEADALAAKPNPLRSDGHVDMLVALHSPSVGGNQLGHGGKLSALASSAGGGRPTGSRVGENQVPRGNRDRREMALHALGYTEPVQEQLLKTARTRIERQQASRGAAPTGPGAHRPVSSTPPGTAPRLEPHEITARAHGQVQEHLDEALHGTRRASQNRNEQIIADLDAQQAAGSHGVGIETAAGRDTPAPGSSAKGGGLGMTSKRTPVQRAQRAAVRDLTRSKGGWAALQNADHLEAARQNDLQVLDLRQKARRAAGVAPEERNTMSPGADPEAKARRNAQPVFSTGPAAPYKPTGKEGVGVPSEGPKSKVLPARPREGAVSPIPTNLPSGPAKLGRTRTERGVRGSTAPWATPEGGTTVSYSGAIASYEASRPKSTPKTQGKVRGKPKSNVDVAQTEPPKGA